MSYQDYVDFFLAAPARVVKIECLEISHSQFSQVYRVVRNVTAGVAVTHEDGQQYFYQYYPLKIENIGARNDLDSGFSVTLGDLGEIMAKEIGNVMQGDAKLEKPAVLYRAYRSDILTRPMEGPRKLQIKDTSYNMEGATFEAKAQSLNINRTGELYTFDRFPSLRGFL